MPPNSPERPWFQVLRQQPLPDRSLTQLRFDGHRLRLPCQLSVRTSTLNASDLDQYRTPGLVGEFELALIIRRTLYSSHWPSNTTSAPLTLRVPFTPDELTLRLTQHRTHYQMNTRLYSRVQASAEQHDLAALTRADEARLPRGLSVRTHDTLCLHVYAHDLGHL